VVGCTLWSYVPDKHSTQVGYHLNDYRRIYWRKKDNEKSPRNISPEDTTKMHADDVKHIEEAIELAQKNGEPVVVLTHHSPIMEYGCSNAEYWSSPTRNAFAYVHVLRTTIIDSAL
jgi:phosphoribosyl 1,2-cyclic phosphodiesterase